MQPEPTNPSEARGSDPRDDVPRFQFRLRTLLLVMTVLCVFFAVPISGLVMGAIAAWIVIAMGTVGIIVLVQFPLFVLFRYLGWLPQVQRDRPFGEDKHIGR